jgi:hypothetical protein
MSDQTPIAAENAEAAFAETWFAEHPETEECGDDMTDEEVEAWNEGLAEATWRARLAAGADWDQRRARRFAAVDALLAESLPPLADAGTVSSVSGLSTSRPDSSEGAAMAEAYARA